jgi:endo-1,4-beta-xylanase
MQSILPVVILFCLFCAATATSSQGGGKALLPDGAATGLRPEGDAAVRVRPVTATGLPFAQAAEIVSPGAGERPRVSTGAGPIEDFDVVHLSFWIKAEKEGTTLAVQFEPPESGFSYFLRMPVTAGREWKRHQYPFTVRRAPAMGEAKIVFVLPNQPATLHVGGLELTNYAKSRRPSDLPVTSLDYEGREAGAQWRIQARQRIEQMRKAPLAVTVVNGKGEPVPGAQVSVRMKKHAFGFGTAVSVPVLSGRSPGISPHDVDAYKREIARLFNMAVIENALKWPQWADRRNRPDTLEAVRWLREQGLAVRGHVLVWPSWRWTPVEEALAAKNDPPALAEVIRRHIRDAAETLSGQLAEWDVINEPFSNHDFMDILGREAMVDWFRTARQADPHSRLFINDYGILSGNDREHQDHYFDTIRFLLDSGAPLDGIGMQGHFPPQPTAPEEVLRRLDRFAVFGKTIKITEFDIDTTDEFLQAEFTRDFLTAAFSHPSVSGFLMWGFWEGRHWKPNGAMYRRDWSLKPNAHVFEDLVFRQWWTNADLVTDALGAAATRGFLGDYEVTISAGDFTRTLPATLSKEGLRLAVTVPENR